jgi:hypothetical protein
MSVDKKDVLKKVKGAKRSAARRTRKGGKLRKAGQHWYELEEYFDEKQKKIIGVNESGYMLGVLEDFVVVQVPEDYPLVDLDLLGNRLADMGIKALIVKEGIRFLRLREITGEQEKKLNEILERRTRFDEKQKEIDRVSEERGNGNGADSKTDSKTERADNLDS